MQMVVFLLLGVALVVVQTTVMQLLPGSFTKPDLIFLLVAFCAYKFAWIPGILLSFIVGWILDVLVGIHLGIYPLEFLFCFICLKLVKTHSPVKESVYQIPLIGVSYFLLQMARYFFGTLTLEYTLPVWSWGEVVKETLLLVLAAIPCFLLFNSLHEYLLRRKARSRPATRKAKSA